MAQAGVLGCCLLRRGRCEGRASVPYWQHYSSTSPSSVKQRVLKKPAAFYNWRNLQWPGASWPRAVVRVSNNCYVFQHPQTLSPALGRSWDCCPPQTIAWPPGSILRQSSRDERGQVCHCEPYHRGPGPTADLHSSCLDHIMEALGVSAFCKHSNTQA